MIALMIHKLVKIDRQSVHTYELHSTSHTHTRSKWWWNAHQWIIDESTRWKLLKTHTLCIIWNDRPQSLSIWFMKRKAHSLFIWRKVLNRPCAFLLLINILVWSNFNIRLLHHIYVFSKKVFSIQRCLLLNIVMVFFV